MEIVYTYDAKRRMAQRKATPEQVKEALAWPDDTLLGDQGEGIAIKRFGTREIKVVYEDTGREDTIVVYTVIARRLKERRRRTGGDR